MGDILYTLIYPTIIKNMDIEDGDILACPPDCSAVSPEDWQIMCNLAGSEAALIAALGVTDERQNQIW